jgi:hypothetical protein
MADLTKVVFIIGCCEATQIYGFLCCCVAEWGSQRDEDKVSALRIHDPIATIPLAGQERCRSDQRLHSSFFFTMYFSNTDFSSL